VGWGVVARHQKGWGVANCHPIVVGGDNLTLAIPSIFYFLFFTISFVFVFKDLIFLIISLKNYYFNMMRQKC
jgi:hypothetical protein